LNEKINLLFLVSKFDIGGVQKVNISMINGIDKMKFNVHVLYLKEGILKNELEGREITIARLGDKLKLKSLINIKYINRVIKYIKKNKIEIVHSIDPVLYIVGSTAAHFTKIIHIRSQPNFIRRHEKLNAYTMKILPFEKWTSRYITFNVASKKDLQLAGVSSKKINIIYDYSKHEEYVNFEKLTDVKKEFNIPTNNKIIFAMHRMVLKKGFETFIEMIPYVIREYKNVTFLLVGDGPLRDELEKKVINLKIQDYVRFIGFRTDIINIIKQIDFGVYPLADTAGMVTAIRGGKVLITKKNSSMDEYIKNGETGYLLSNDTPEAYAEYALRLLNDEMLLKCMENEQMNFIRERFDGNKNINELENILIKLYEEHKGSK
jgi:glycosyltransferase involved in cell wall biosynthesis